MVPRESEGTEREEKDMKGFRTVRERRRRVLRDIALFSGCTDKQLERIAGLTTEHWVPARREMTVAGEDGREFFVVVRGTATVRRDGVVLGTVGPGSFFGELSLLDGAPRSATVVADTDMILLVMSRTEFRSPYFLIPPVMERMLAELGRRLRHAGEALTAPCEPAPPTRLLNAVTSSSSSRTPSLVSVSTRST
jgi:CRP/FNR family transcriptional regulator, cyclic AMP receptor protein